MKCKGKSKPRCKVRYSCHVEMSTYFQEKLQSFPRINHAAIG